MRHLRTIDPVSSLKGKLGFMKLNSQPILSILKLANSLQWSSSSPQISSLSSISIQQITSLETPTPDLTSSFKKMKFEAHVHRNSNLNAPIGTIYENLNKQQKRLVSSLLNFSHQLNAKQINYLQYTLRQKINAILPNWQNLHWNNESPLRRQFMLMPNIQSINQLYEMKLLSRKSVSEVVAETRPKKQVEKVEEVAPVEPEKGKGKK